MKLMVFNTVKSDISIMLDAVCIRLSYLIANDTVISSDAAAYLINVEGTLDRSLDSKVNILAMRGAKEFAPDDNKMLLMQKNIKDFQKSKTKDGKSIARYKKMESAVNNYFAAYMAPNIKKGKQMSLSQLKELSDKQEFCYDEIDVNKLEGHPKGRNEKANVHELLLRPFDVATEEDLIAFKKNNPAPYKDEPQTTFLLQSNFLDLAQWHCTATIVDAAHPSAAYSSSLVIEPFAALQNLFQPTAVVLEAIRKSILPDVLDFNKACNQWIDLCAQDNDLGFQYFKEHMLPAKAALAHTLESSEFLANATKPIGDTKDFATLKIGLVPVALLAQYFKNMNAIHDETVSLYNSKLAELGKTNARIPVIICQIKLKEPKNSEPLPATIISVKKSLDID